MISNTNNWSLMSAPGSMLYAPGSSNTGIREVFRDNFKEEEDKLLRTLNRYKAIAFDTEFPGTIIDTPRFADEETRYRNLKANVERTKLIQVGFTVFDPVTSEIGGVWQFNMAGFSTKFHDHAPDSIKMLKDCGIDFEENFEKGVRMMQFTRLLKLIREVFDGNISWVTFHGLYDVGYFMAALSGVWKLPNILGFADAVGSFFTGGVFDLKTMAGRHSWMGLEKFSAMVGEAREEGKAHQAGSDSLLTAKTFAKTVKLMTGYYGANLVPFRGILFGIKVPMVSVRSYSYKYYVPVCVYVASPTISIVH